MSLPDILYCVPVSLRFPRCDPVHAKYHFLTHPLHCTVGIPQASEVAWNDTHVILLGTIDRQLLVEYLRGPPLVVEVHDRSLRQVDGSKPALFGEETRDDVLGTHAFTAGLDLLYGHTCTCGCVQIISLLCIL